MAKVTMDGSEFQLIGEPLMPGQDAPDFEFVKEDLSVAKLSELGDGVKVVIAIPSLETRVCQMETKNFNDKMKDLEGVKGLVISKDLPLAMKRYSDAKGIDNIERGSDYRGGFTAKYKTEITEGPFTGLSARAVFVISRDNKIAYTELVPDVGSEPNYDKVLEAVKNQL